MAQVKTPEAETKNNAPQEVTQQRQRAAKLFEQGNWQDALNIYQKLLLDKQVQGPELVKDLDQAYQCLNRLGLLEKLDELMTSTLAAHENDWRLLHAAAMLIVAAPSHGMLDGDKFIRAPRTQRPGIWMVSHEQDRAQALKWLQRALTLCGEVDGQVLADKVPADTVPASDKESAEKAVEDRGSAAERAALWKDVLSVLLRNRTDKWGWRLQSKTDIEAKIQFDSQDLSYAPSRDAPVDDQGQPIFYALPASWAAAQSDGERCRWAVKRAGSLDDPESADAALLAWANFLQSQFSVSTLREQMWIWNMQTHQNSSQEGGDRKIADDVAAMLEVHTLGDNETIAKLASGIRRFTFPKDQNPLEMFKSITTSSSTSWQSAIYGLKQTYLDRRQRPKAVQVLNDAIATAKQRQLASEARQQLQTELDDITQARARFESLPAQVVGQPIKLDLTFRNAKQAKFTARRIDLEKLLAKLKAESRNKPSDLLWRIEQPHELVENHLDEFVTGQAIKWTVDLQPGANYLDRRIDISTPLDKAGHYIIDAEFDGGVHRARCSLWVNDLAIVHKATAKDHWFYVADAVTGQPLAGQTVEFIGIGQKLTNTAKKTDAEGQVRFVDPASPESGQISTWLAVARDGKGRLAISSPMSLQVHGMYYGDQRPSAFKAYGVVEQPIYRPGSTVKAKVWLGTADYANAKPLQNKSIQITVRDPRAQEFWKGDLTTDAAGSIRLEFPMPAAAALGVYSVQIQDPAIGQAYDTNMSFRVEEFRKPEFEVQVEAPEKGIKLGETIEAKIRAKYYFGTPVTDAKVTVKVTRTAFVDDWYPIRPFDWCYGRGYWWFAGNFEWYPGWHQWKGCFPIMPPWRPYNPEPPELVTEQDLQLDADGVAKIRIDTAMAAKFQSKQDHQYAISVEVRDASRRTITAEGSVVAAREPFKVYTWLNRGFYRINETVEANFIAQTLNRKPVQGTGKVDLLRVTYDDQRQPKETVVESWDAKTDENGYYTQKFVTRRGGQYRLRLKLKDAEGHEVEGAYLFTVRGDNQAADNFRFSELELIPDKAEYAPGENVELQINADRADANVIVFIRPGGSSDPQATATPKPRRVQLVNKSASLTIPVEASDQPNFFVEALTIYNGKFYQTVREIFVPPAKKAWR